MTTQNADF